MFPFPFRVRRSPEGWSQNQGPVLTRPVRGQQLPGGFRLSVGDLSREGLRRRAHLPDVWNRGGGGLWLWLHGAVWWSWHQISPARTLLWLGGENILSPETSNHERLRTTLDLFCFHYWHKSTLFKLKCSSWVWVCCCEGACRSTQAWLPRTYQSRGETRQVGNGNTFPGCSLNSFMCFSNTFWSSAQATSSNLLEET